MNTPPFARLTAEFKANPRLRAGIWLCIAIVWLYGILVLQDIVAAKSREYEALSKHFARIQAVTDQKENWNWEGRLHEARAIEKILTDRLWREQTQGLAQAAFQDWLVQALQQLAIAKPQLTVVAQDGPRPQDGTGYGDVAWKVSARLAFDFDPKTFTAFVGKLAENEKSIVLETLNVRSAPSPRVEMTIVAFFAKAAE